MPEGVDDWLGACGRAADRIGAALAGMEPATRREQIGRGAGGDTTIRIDSLAEQVVVEEIEALGVGVELVAEEAGNLTLNGGGPTRVVVDPIDGSLNAGRAMTPFALSVAIADGPLMGNVHLGFVHDFGTGERFTARRDGGAFVDGVSVRHGAPADRLELVLVEGAIPRRVARAGAAFEGRVGRLRAIGSLALSLCYAGAGRGDAMIGLGPGRSVDVAAAQLFAREAGLLVGMPLPEDLAGAPLDVTTHRTIAGARDLDTLLLLLSALDPADRFGPR